MAVSRRLRFEILRRDNYTCRYCGASAPNVKLTVDHVRPTALGGSDEPENLVTACQLCNAGKTSIAPDSPLVDDVAADALRWASAIALAAEVQRARHREREEYLMHFDEAWGTWTYSEDSREISRPDDWEMTISRHFDLGLDIDDLRQLLRGVLPRAAHPDTTNVPYGKVHDSGMWRYFCGALRNHMAQRAEIAAELLAEGACE